MTLTFVLLASKWGHGSPVSWASVLPIFSLLEHSRLRVRHGTDRQTDRRRPSMRYAPPYGGGGHSNFDDIILRGINEISINRTLL